ncbi:MAG: hypothetical protein IIA82_04540 [Thaumarchaeota archaeon]|nr:hypothetical protein [Nitrososphaerota archaeon]
MADIIQESNLVKRKFPGLQREIMIFLFVNERSSNVVIANKFELTPQSIIKAVNELRKKELIENAEREFAEIKKIRGKPQKILQLTHAGISTLFTECNLTIDEFWEIIFDVFWNTKNPAKFSLPEMIKIYKLHTMNIQPSLEKNTFLLLKHFYSLYEKYPELKKWLPDFLSSVGYNPNQKIDKLIELTKKRSKTKISLSKLNKYFNFDNNRSNVFPCLLFFQTEDDVLTKDSKISLTIFGIIFLFLIWEKPSGYKLSNYMLGCHNLIDKNISEFFEIKPIWQKIKKITHDFELEPFSLILDFLKEDKTPKIDGVNFIIDTFQQELEKNENASMDFLNKGILKIRFQNKNSIIKKKLEKIEAIWNFSTPEQILKISLESDLSDNQKRLVEIINREFFHLLIPAHKVWRTSIGSYFDMTNLKKIDVEMFLSIFKRQISFLYLAFLRISPRIQVIEENNAKRDLATSLSTPHIKRSEMFYDEMFENYHQLWTDLTSELKEFSQLYSYILKKISNITILQQIEMKDLRSAYETWYDDYDKHMNSNSFVLALEKRKEFQEIKEKLMREGKPHGIVDIRHEMGNVSIKLSEQKIEHEIPCGIGVQCSVCGKPK